MTSVGPDHDRLISTELVTLADPPTSSEGCLDFLLDVAVAAGRVDDPDRALADLRQQADRVPIGVGCGLAVAHASTPAVSRPFVIVGRSATGVDFDAVDDEPAHLLFVLLSPRDDPDHLDYLCSLSTALFDEPVREAIRSATSTESVRTALLEGWPTRDWRTL